VKKKLIFEYYNYKMICRKQLPYLEKRGTPISNLWEIRLSPKLWARVIFAARSKNVSYSWIVRYCVFRLAKRKCLRMFPAMENLSRKIRENQPRAEKCHRHMLCLYGADEKLLRLRALQLGITVSMMVRLALEWFLFKIEKSIECKHSFQKGRVNAGCDIEASEKNPTRFLDASDFFWRGIKLCAAIKCKLDLFQTFPQKILTEFTQFAKSDWCNIWLNVWKDCPYSYLGEI